MVNPPPPHKSAGVNTVLVVAAAFIGVVVIVCITAVAIAVDDGARAASMIALIVGPLATLLAFFALFVRQESTSRTLTEGLAQVQHHTTELTNGLGDAKFRAAVADVLPDHLIDPGIQDQLERDRARRTAAAQAAAALVEPHAFPEEEGL